MSINRSVSRSKEVVYTIETNDAMGRFHGVIDENNVLLITFPGHTMSGRRHTNLLDKLLEKAKHRDGIKDHKMLYLKVLEEEGKELLIKPAPADLTETANQLQR